MKTEATTNSANSFSFASSSNQKYAGILEKSAAKMLRKELSELLSYVYSVSPPFMTLHYVIMFFRLLQLIGPSLNPGFLDFWSTDYPSEKTMYVFSIFFYLIPPAEHEKATLPTMIVYLVITAVFLILLLVSAKVFKKKANLPSFIPPLIACYFYSFGFVLPPVAIELMFSQFSDYIFSEHHYENLTQMVIILVLTVLVTAAYLYIFLLIALQVLTFQPMSFITVTTAPQTFMVLAVLVINAFIGLCELANKTITAVFCIISALFYAAASLLAFYKGGIIKHKESVMYMAACYTGCITSIVIAIFQLLDMNATMVIIGIFIAVFVISYFVCDLLIKRVKTRRLQVLDLIVDDPECFTDTVKSVNHYINLVVTGFSEVHPICLNWSFLKMGIEHWPKNGDVWYTYAKFCAIYPEETQTLAWIFRSIIMNKVKGRAAKTVKEQSLSVARQREANLSPDLKTKLNSITKHITAAKHKLRNVWDMAIQGNISDMEIATKRAIKAIKQSNGDLLHILRLFPNNRFVTRQYARFCKELLADYSTCADMIEKSRLLHRNINVNKDQTHEYGITAFPMLPEKLMKSDTMALSQVNNNDTLTSSVFDLDEQEGGDNQERDETSVFLGRIEKLRIPSTTGMAIISLLLYFIVFALPIIVILVYIPSFIDSLTAPLEYMHDLSLARTLVFQLTSFGIEILLEQMNIIAKPDPVNPDSLPVNFGDTADTRLQLAYLCKQMTGVQQNVEEFRTYKINNANMDRAKEEIFSEKINYTYYNKILPTFKMISVQNAISDIVTQQRDLMSNNTLKDDIVNTSALLNPITSLLPVVTAFDDSLSYMIDYISDNDNEKQKLITILEYVILAIGAILYIVSIVVGILWIQSNKEEAYRCLTSLPKNTVSQLAENLRILKKETENSMSTQTNTETNKQEDNILKIFMTGGTNGANSHDSVFIAILLAVIMVCQVVSCVLLGTEMVSISSELRRNCPHLNYLQGVYSNIVAASGFINALVGLNYDNTTITSIDRDDLVTRTNNRLQKARNFYNMARFGGEDIEEPPFSGYRQAVIASDEQFECGNHSEIHQDLLENCKCYTADDIVILAEAIYHSRLVPFQEIITASGDPNRQFQYDEVFSVVWELFVYPVYDIFIYPMSETIIDTITEDLNELYNDRVIFLVVLIVLGFIFEVIFLALIYSIDEHIRGVLKLLLHCEPKVIATTAKVMSVLDGDFRSKRGDDGTRSQKFYESVCQDLPNAFIVCSPEKVIESTNKSVNRIFGEDSVSQCVGKSITDLITSDKFQGNIDNLLNVQAPKVVTETLTYADSQSGSTTNLEATSMIINNKIVIEFRDVTQTVRYNTLINEEKQKSDKLLSSILPASLVPRVQAGEKNISFAVQTATIVFMDIVSFTPWCGSLPAEKVMSTLNALFRKNDNLVAKYTTMTKIKCIGDCYVAAGGVFAEVNQPAVHAKEVVNFGLDALDAIRELNGELNESLQIRVGINTGGPIVAGVLGIGKPTFEILGPAINMAQQMEHHGVPMQVHVSRSVYELIYGDAFTIKERGQIEVKNGSVITYLVNRKK